MSNNIHSQYTGYGCVITCHLSTYTSVGLVLRFKNRETANSWYTIRLTKYSSNMLNGDVRDRLPCRSHQYHVHPCRGMHSNFEWKLQGWFNTAYFITSKVFIREIWIICDDLVDAYVGRWVRWVERTCIHPIMQWTTWRVITKQEQKWYASVFQWVQWVIIEGISCVVCPFFTYSYTYSSNNENKHGGITTGRMHNNTCTKCNQLSLAHSKIIRTIVLLVHLYQSIHGFTNQISGAKINKCTDCKYSTAPTTFPWSLYHNWIDSTVEPVGWMWIDQCAL